MADNDLDIVLRVRASDDAEQVITRTLSSIQKAAESQGRKIGKSVSSEMARAMREERSLDRQNVVDNIFGTSAAQQVKAFMKAMTDQKIREIGIQEAAEKSALEKTNRLHKEFRAAMLNQRLEEIAKVESAERAAEDKRQRDIKAFRAAMLNQRLEEIAKTEAAEKASLEKLNRLREAASLGLVGPQIPQAVQQQRISSEGFQVIQDPLKRRAEIESLRNDTLKLNEAYQKGTISLEEHARAMTEVNSKQALLETGNARARGALHKMTAALASFTFELTGAIYGLTALGTALASPAIFGTSFLKGIEDAKHGMSGTISAMSMVSGLQMNYSDASKIASSEIDALNKKSIQYNISLQDIATTYQAIIGPGLAAGMTLKEVGQIAAIGTMAVKSLSLNSTQVVQEVRDLVQGGIQASSSTLATALGLKDADIKAAKQSTEGLFVFLEKRLAGYTSAALERQNTLTGAWDVLKTKVQRLFADEQGFNQLKGFINDISNSIATIDYKTGEIKFNPNLVAVANDYLAAMRGIGSVIGDVVSATGSLLKVSADMGHAPIAALIAYNSYLSLAATQSALLTTNLNLATIASNKLAFALSGLGSFLLGYTFGKVMYEQFETARKAGVIFVASTARLLESLKYGFNEVGLAVGLITNVLSGKGIADSLSAYYEQRGKLKDAHNEQVKFINDYYNEAMKEAERASSSQMASSEKVSEFEVAVRRSQAKKELEILANKTNDAKSIQDSYQKTVNQAVNLYKSATEGETDQSAIKKSLEQYNRTIEDAAKDRDKKLKALNSDSLKSSKLHYRELLEAYGTFEQSLQERIASGTLSFVGAYNERLVKIEELQKSLRNYKGDDVAVQQQKLSKELAQSAKEYAEGWKRVTKEVKETWTDVFGETQLSGDKWFADFNLKFRAQMKELALMMADAKTTEQIDEITKAVTKLGEAKGVSKLVRDFKNLSDVLGNVEKSYQKAATAIELNVAKMGGGAWAEEIGARQTIEQLQKKATEQQAELNKVQEQYAGQLDNLPPQAQAAYDEAIAKIQQTQTEMYKLKNAQDMTFGSGVRKTFQEYEKNSRNYSKIASEVFTKAFQTMEDAMVSFIKTGKFSFKGFVDYIKDLLIRLAAQKFIVEVGGMLNLGTVGGKGVMPGGQGGFSLQNAGGLSNLGFGGSFENVASFFGQSIGFGTGMSLTTSQASTAAKSYFEGASLAFEQGNFEFAKELSDVGHSLTDGASMMKGAGQALGYASSIYNLSQGKYASAALTAAATATGNPLLMIGANIVGPMLDKAFGSSGAPKSMTGAGGRMTGGAVSYDPTGQQHWTDYTSQNKDMAKAIYNDAVVSLINTVNKSYSGGSFIKGEINVKGSSSNQVLAQVTDAANNTVYHFFQEVGKGFDDYKKFVEEQLPKVNLAMVVDAMRSSSEDYKAIANSLVGDSTNLTDTLKSLDTNGVTALTNSLTTAISAFKTINNQLDLVNKTVSGADFIKLSELAGGIDALSGSISVYYQKFFTEEERMQVTQKELAEQFKNTNLVMPTTKEQFRNLVSSLNLTTDSGKQTFATLMKLAPTFADVADSMQKTAEQQANEAKLAVEQKISEARSAVEQSYSAETSRIQHLQDQWKNIVDSLKKFRNSLLLSNLSTLSPEQRYLEARRQFEMIAISAKGGDIEAIQGLESASNTFLEASQGYYASSEAYAQDFNLVLQTLGNAESIAERELRNSEQQLSALNQMVDGVIGVKGAVLSLQVALGNLSVLQQQQQQQQQQKTIQKVPQSQITTSIADAYLDYLGRKPEEAGFTYWYNQVQSGGATISDVVKAISDSPEATVNKLYQDILGRAPDAVGQQYWMNQIASGVSAEAIASGMKASDEYANYVNGSHADGLSFVPFDGYRAELHKGERVLTAAQTSAMDTYAKLMERLMENQGSVQPSSDNKSIPVLQAGFNGVIEKLDKVEKRLEGIENEQRKTGLDK